MKKITTIVAILCTLLLSSVVLAQEGEDVTEYEFEDKLVEGDLIRPDGVVLTGRTRDNSRSLVKVRRHFVPEMLKSVERI